jgi:transcriptional regulator with PAS, ATPase and Fis domain
MTALIIIFIFLIYVTIKLADLKFFDNNAKIDEIKEIFTGLSHTQEELAKYHDLLAEKEIENIEIDHKYKETSMLFNRILNTIHNIIIVRDINDKITLINQYAANFLKIDRQEALGCTIQEILSRNVEFGISGSFGNSCDSAKKKITETLQPIIFIDDGILYGSYTSVRIIMSPLVDHNEHLVGTVAIGYSNLEFLQEIIKVLQALREVNNMKCATQECHNILKPAESQLIEYLVRSYSMDGRLPEILQRQLKGVV